MSSIDHILFYIFMYWIFIRYDKLSFVTQNKKRLRDTKFLCILSFVLVEGLRYGRGRDFFHYGRSYLQYARDEIAQPVYKFFQNLLYSIDFTTHFLPYGAIFLVISLVFILSIFKYESLFSGKAKYFCFFSLLATQYIFEWTIRQGLSFGLILVGLLFLENKLRVKALFFVALGLSFHYGNVFFVALIITFYYTYYRRPIPLFISLPLLIIVSYLVDAFNYMVYVQQVVTYFDLSFLGENFTTYSNVDRWFSRYAVMDSMKRNFATTTMTTLFYSSVLIVGHANHKVCDRWTYIYNTYVVSLIVYVPFYLNEILNRILFPGTVLWFVPVSLAMANVPFKKANIILKIAYIVLFGYLIMYYGRFVFLNPTGSYVWNPLPERMYYR